MGRKTRRYQPLYDLLAETTEGEITLTFAEITALIGPLPLTAISHASWWTMRHYTQVVGWEALGWRAHADRRAYRVRFERHSEAAT